MNYIYRVAKLLTHLFGNKGCKPFTTLYLGQDFQRCGLIEYTNIVSRRVAHNVQNYTCVQAQESRT